MVDLLKHQLFSKTYPLTYAAYSHYGSKNNTLTMFLGSNSDILAKRHVHSVNLVHAGSTSGILQALQSIIIVFSTCIGITVYLLILITSHKGTWECIIICILQNEEIETVALECCCSCNSPQLFQKGLSGALTLYASPEHRGEFYLQYIVCWLLTLLNRSNENFAKWQWE